MTSLEQDPTAVPVRIDVRGSHQLALERSMFRLAAELAAMRELPEIGRTAVESLSSLLGARAVSLVVAGRPGQRPLLLASTLATGECEPEDGDSRPSPWLALRRARTLQRAARLAASSPAMARGLARLEADWVLPLLRRDELMGVLVVGRKEGGETCCEAELGLLRFLGAQLAVLVESADLLERATYESLTGALRRETALSLLEREVDRLHRYRRPLAVLMVDLDRFKEVNDRHGHLVGDALLRRVAGALAVRLRASDLLGRFGGDELLVVLPDTGEGPARVVAEDLSRAAAAVRVTSDRGESVGVTVSIGATVVEELDGGRAPGTEHLLTAADAALYQAKRDGRDRIVFLPTPARLLTGAARRKDRVA
ncbi:MAG TPA: sensor domain-containing diguanylate cyclase [Thermoanaerobaculia bacterium]|nr:sensor domain-containing diguanylate cyclase [Thermoanaerobaculia bacterium]